MVRLMMIITVVITLFLGQICTSNKDLKVDILANQSDSVSYSFISRDSLFLPENMANVIGMVSSFNRDGESFTIYREDLTVMKSFSFQSEIDISPYAWHPDYFLLVFRCIEKDSNFFHIIVDEPTRKIGLIKVNDLNFMFQTLEEHILSVASVDFDAVQNPIKEYPDSQSKTKMYEKDEFFFPVEIQKEWLKIKWGTEDKWNYGWIKWRDKKKELIVELFYIL